MKDTETYILLFDGVCNLCNSMVDFTIKRDPGNKFKFAALQSESGKSLLSSLDLKADNLDSFVLIMGNNYFVKSTAGLHVLRKLGGVWRLCYVFIYIPRPIRDFIYDLIAKTRYRIFDKRDTCMVPTADIKQRFL